MHTIRERTIARWFLPSGHQAQLCVVQGPDGDSPVLKVGWLTTRADEKLLWEDVLNEAARMAKAYWLSRLLVQRGPEKRLTQDGPQDG